jgi:predicted glycosyltransferase
MLAMSVEPPKRGLAMSVRKLRVVLYSHDAMGMGHMRRNLLLAQTLAGPPIDASVLLITGAHEANAFAIPAGADCLTLPAMRKGLDGQYNSRSLALPLSHLIDIRAAAIRAAVEAFSPDLMIVDKVPRGAFRELDATLAHLRRRRGARCVLGLRDVLDEPEVVRREWAEAGNTEAIRELYDAVWIYGDPTVYDLLREYDMPAEVTERARFTGYLDARTRAVASEAEEEALLVAAGLADRRFVLCQLGGGQDGVEVADMFSHADLPADMLGVLLTGPFMPGAMRQRLQRRASASDRLRVLEFAAEPTILLKHAERVVAMGGYNTVCEVLSFDKRALIVPRTTPRREQLIRAERLADLGAVDVRLPAELSPELLGEWVGSPAPLRDPVFERIDFNGLARLPNLVDELVTSARYASLN